MLLLLAAFFWGTTFVSQSVAAEKLPTFTYLGLRCLIACVFIFVAIKIFDKVGIITNKPKTKPEKMILLRGGLICGAVLFATMAVQQYGMNFTTAGKAGFVTALYIIMVPVAGFFFGNRPTLLLTISIVLALVGMYYLCISGGEASLGKGDFMMVLAAGGCTAHILLLDHFSPKVDGVRLSLMQFIFIGIVSIVIALLTEQTTLAAIIDCAGPILYAAVFSSGVAYTLQILAQRELNPTVASIVMSFESVFSVFAGCTMLGEKLTSREAVGCVIMFIAIILSQIPSKKKTLKEVKAK